MIQKIIELFEESINFGMLPQAKSILIFLAELSYIGLFDIFSLMEILKDLINEAEKVNKQ